MINDLENEIRRIKDKLLNELEQIQSHETFRNLRDRYLSRKKGIISALTSNLKKIDPANKPLAGKLINDLKVIAEKKFTDIESRLSQTREEKVDYTLPEVNNYTGNTHLLTQIRREIENIFLNFGYEIAYGPEIELDENNFTLLNFKEDHPARDEQDTFFISGYPDTLLRTHTSPVQVRYMKESDPPIKIISPGRVFRKDEPDATHSPVFNQIEGLLVDKNINFSHLKGTLEIFIRSFFGENINLRFRPGYFPFTEPSAEVDISCFLCFGEDKNCKICKGTGWLEILGSGMVHREVLKNCNIDPDVYRGFAFGMGVERIAMLKYGVTDLRYLYENDLRFNSQFG
ncbi:MAG: phenylalanine--tRNA ligase subunit alpha [Acidobacteriota bacterium]